MKYWVAGIACFVVFVLGVTVLIQWGMIWAYANSNQVYRDQNAVLEQRSEKIDEILKAVKDCCGKTNSGSDSHGSSHGAVGDAN